MNVISHILVLFAFIIIIFLFFRVFISKLKYYRVLNGKDYNGFEDLFSFFSVELWLTGFTWFFPLFGKNINPEINSLKKNSNNKLLSFYISLPLIFVLIAIVIKSLLFFGYSS